jgi:ketosteroid isomerase-like protein
LHDSRERPGTCLYVFVIRSQSGEKIQWLFSPIPIFQGRLTGSYSSAVYILLKAVGRIVLLNISNTFNLAFKRLSIMNKNLGLLFCTLCLCILIACNEVIKEKTGTRLADKELIEKAINNTIGWAINKDFNLLHSVIANDTNYLEVHPDGTVVKGIDEFKKAEADWRSPDFKAIRHEIRDLRINISESGDFAWWYGILDDVNEWKGQPSSWMDTRWTGVLEKREDKWIIVQMHFSSPCD